MRVVLAEHHRYDSPLKVGSHQIADLLRPRVDELVWLSHPRSRFHRVLGPLAPLSRRHPDGVREVVLRPIAPYLRFPLLDTVGWGRRWLRSTQAARRRIRRLVGERCDLFWISDFTCLGLLDELSCGSVVFRFFDRLDQFPWMPRSIYALARRYRDRADAVLASSRSVQRHLAAEGIAAEYLPNGARLPPEAERRAAVASVRDRLVVYVGAVAEWFDLATVELWARSLPGTAFVVAGPVSVRVGEIPPNLRFVGPVPYEDVHGLLSRARAGIIPFRRTPLTDGIHPLKLYDYLAAGCPVVSADLPEVAPVPGAVEVYRTPQEGLERLAACLTGPVDRERLVELAAASSWESRLGGLLERLGVPGRGR